MVGQMVPTTEAYCRCSSFIFACTTAVNPQLVSSLPQSKVHTSYCIAEPKKKEKNDHNKRSQARLLTAKTGVNAVRELSGCCYTKELSSYPRLWSVRTVSFGGLGIPQMTVFLINNCCGRQSPHLRTKRRAHVARPRFVAGL